MCTIEIFDKVSDYIINRKYKVLGIGDIDLSEEDFNKYKTIMNDSFEKVLGEKSSFEK